MSLVLAVILCLGSGFLLVSLGWPRRAPVTIDLSLRASISVGYGLGIFSVILLLARVFVIRRLIAMDLAVFVILLALFLLFHSRNPVPAVPDATAAAPHTAFDRALAIAFVLALCAAIYSSIVRTVAFPHGNGWDSFAIWNLHARFLFRGGAYDWRALFNPLVPWTHPDYPLLVPGAAAHFWVLLGRDTPSAPAIVGLLFTYATVVVLYSALSTLRGRTAALLGGITLLTTPFFIEQSAAQYADIPLAFFFLASIVFLCLSDRLGKAALLVQAGIASGFAAWTKNEGLLFLSAITAARLIVAIRSGVLRPPQPGNPTQNCARPSFMPYLASAVPASLLILWFKHSLAPPGDLFSDPGATFSKLLSPARYWVIVQWFVKSFFRFGHWLIPATVLLIALYFIVRSDRRTTPSASIGVCVSRIALVVTVAGYFAIYLITPYDIYWHLRFSLTRLFLQLWPSAIFLFFLAFPGLSDGDRPFVSN